MQVGAEEGGEVGTRLGDDEVVHVEEFCDAVERGFTVCVGRWVRPGAEGGFFGAGPGDDVAVFVFAEERDRAVEGGRGGVGGKGGGPDKLLVVRF